MIGDVFGEISRSELNDVGRRCVASLRTKLPGSVRQVTISQSSWLIGQGCWR